ncbi:SRPBCC family protein [Rhodovulum sp. BSW8]|uniref:SRPBCC family protein n=1 Tax=Rhodovulum sp. BSW8 TaxID=2259645 RepID=UPI000DE40324|nr:SRPBCC family protein [Rhodovulum sp. BSW8]RBO54740.1 SRPBCC family protein [Rhodovulum sp. BSW8]
MARAYASAVIPAPIEKVWEILRDFNGLPSWHPAIERSEIEDGRSADAVGAVRSFHLAGGAGHVREKLLSLDDSAFTLSYSFVKPAFPVENYIARIALFPVSETGETFALWEAVFDEAPEDRGKYGPVISEGVFAAGWAALKRHLA